MTRYRVPVRVEVRHEFFDDARARGLVLEPTPDTARRLVNLGWLFRTEGGVLSVLRPDPDDRTRDEEVVLEFRLAATDRAFATFTDLDGWRPGHPYVFDTASASAPDDAGSRPLTRGVTVSAQDLSAAPAGSRRVADTVATGGTLAQLVLRVTAGDPDPPDRTQAFHLTFRARCTHWKYVVLGAPPDATPAIRDVDGRIEFEPSGVAQVPDGRQAVTLRSTEPIALRERAEQRFQLRAQSSAGERVLVKRLAVASPRNLGRDTVDGREVAVSEIYINL